MKVVYPNTEIYNFFHFFHFFPFFFIHYLVTTCSVFHENKTLDTAFSNMLRLTIPYAEEFSISEQVIRAEVDCLFFQAMS